jgi:hypothetical protein
MKTLGGLASKHRLAKYGERSNGLQPSAKYQLSGVALVSGGIAKAYHLAALIGGVAACGYRKYNRRK